MDNVSTTPVQGVEQRPASHEDRVLSILGRNDPPPEPEEERVAEPENPQVAEVEQAQTDELTPDDIPDEQQAEAPSQGDAAFEIVHNGQQHKLSREDAIRYAQQGFDYTQKTQALAETQRQFSERMQRLEQVEQVSQVLASDYATVKAFEAQLSQYQGFDWVKFATENPLDYPAERAKFDQLMQGYQGAAYQYQQKKGAVDQQLAMIKHAQLEAEASQLQKIMPRWADPEKLQEDRKEMVAYLRSIGADPQVVSEKYLDSAFALKTLWQSMQYEKLHKAKSDKVKQLREKPPVMKPGASQQAVSPNVAQAERARERLRKSGDLHDAAAVLLNRMK